MTILSNIFGGRTSAQPATHTVGGVIGVVSNQPGHVLGGPISGGVYPPGYAGLQNQQNSVFGPGHWQALNQLGNNVNALRPHTAIDPNTMPALQCSLDILHGLWAAKYGWEWVQLDEPQERESEFDWARAAGRLQRINLLEYEMGWYRLVPKEWK